jgi:hypothetical protein
MQWRLAEQQHKPTPFLQANIRGSGQKAIGSTMGYLSQAVHRAGRDNHPHGGKTSRGDSSSNIRVGIYVICHASDLVDTDIRLIGQSSFASLRNDEMGFDFQCTRHLQQSDSVHGSSCATDTHNEPLALHGRIDCL